MIAIASYGLGNVKAFANVYHRLNIEHCIADKPEQLKDADRIILPGVGAFDHAMQLLNQSGLRETLDHAVLIQKKPVMGICVGMQMMACKSEEGTLEGLGWVEASVRKFSTEDTKTYPLPHMGWNTLQIDSSHPLFANMSDNPELYFLHSYYFDNEDSSITIATTDYAKRFTTIVQKANIIGIQCHPEKSHDTGVSILKNFASMQANQNA
ncbi:MAG: imidazole glycerol phosphate synthase subunit HisH [Pseudomonadota bacterium]